MCSHFYTFCLSFIVNEMPSKRSWNNQFIFVLSHQFVMLPPAKAVMTRVNTPGALLWKRFSTREGCIKRPERTKKKPTKLKDHKINVPHACLAGTSSLFLCWWPSVVVFVFWLLSHVQLLRPHGLPTRLLCPWDFPGKNTGVGLSFPSPRDLPDPEIEPTVEAPCGGSTES